MNPLSNVALNSIKVIDDRLRQLQSEVKQMEERYGVTTDLEIKAPPKPMQNTTLPRYQNLPSADNITVKKLSIKPQITPEYSRSLKYVPDIFSLYNLSKQEPSYLDEVENLSLPPKLNHDTSLLHRYLDNLLDKLI